MTAPAAARRVCGARSSPRSPAWGCPGTRGSSRGATSTPRRRCSTRSARTLRLDAAERATLFALARTELPLPDGSGDGAGGGCDDGHALLVSLVEGLHPTPAYLLGPMTRILAWNRAASALFGSPDHLAPERRSLLWLLLVDPGEARDNPGREATARNMVARFRSEYARHAGEPAYEEFIAELRQRSPWFAQWWGEHEVDRHPARDQDARAPDAGHAAPAPRADGADRGA